MIGYPKYLPGGSAPPMDISSGSPAPIGPASQPKRIRILHTNDVHGTISPVPDSVVIGHPANLGGSAYLATIVDRARQQEAGRTLLLDSGDAVHGQASTDLDKGQSMMEVMDQVGYDAGTLGNHDFQWGVGNLVDRLARSRHPVVVANVVREDGTPLPNTQPYKIVDIGGMRVGITGLLTAETAQKQRKDRIEGIRFLDEAEALRQQVALLRNQGAELILVMSHMGLEKDREVAQRFPEENLVFLGGHSHDRVTGPERLAGNFLVQAGSQGKEVGELVLELEKSRVVGVEHRLIPVDPATVPADPEVASLVARYEERADREMGKTLTELDRHMFRSEHRDSPVGNMVTDAMRQAAGTQLAFINSDALRTDLEKGPLTRKHLYAMMPFGGDVMKGQLTGEQVMRVLEYSVTQRSITEGVHKPFLQVSGMRFAYDAAEPVGHRVLGVEVDGQPLDPKATYTVALDDYLCLGKMGYSWFTEVEWKPAGAEMLDAMASYCSQGIPANPYRRIVDKTEVGVPSGAAVTPEARQGESPEA